MLEFHDREEKARWWEFFRLRDLREDERAAITGLTCVESRTEMRSFVHRYRFPPQEVSVESGATAYDERGRSAGSAQAEARGTASVR
jgi:hypothetical protein